MKISNEKSTDRSVGQVSNSVYNYCSLAELDKEMAQLRSGLKAVEKEMEYHRTQNQTTVAGDRFVPAVKEFLASATCRFSDLEDKFHDMKNRVSFRSHN